LVSTFVTRNRKENAMPNGEPKNWTVALILSILLGGLGVDRFYLGYIGLGILKLLTGGLCGILYIIDIVKIATNSLPDAQGRPLVKT
jgi:TM2 domain-containing membrane protein YozV